MPPVEKAEDYLDLIAGIETAVTEMGVLIIIEGETPPRDPRLNKFAVTPRPRRDRSESASQQILGRIG